MVSPPRESGNRFFPPPFPSFHIGRVFVEPQVLTRQHHHLLFLLLFPVFGSARDKIITAPQEFGFEVPLANDEREAEEDRRSEMAPFDISSRRKRLFVFGTCECSTEDGFVDECGERTSKYLLFIRLRSNQFWMCPPTPIGSPPSVISAIPDGRGFWSFIYSFGV